MLTGLVNRREFESAPRARAEEREGARDVVRAVLPRPRPVQDRQRHLRPQRRRRAAGPGRRAAQVEGPLARHARAAGRRRVRRAARELLAGRGDAHGRERCARPIAQFPLHLGRARVPPRREHRRGADHGRQRGRRVDHVRRGQRLRRREGSGPQSRHSFAGERHRADAPAARDAVGRAHQRRARRGPLRAVPQTIQPLQRRASPARTTSCCCACATRPARIVAPDDFIAAAERYGLTPAIDRWVIENAFRWLVSEADEREKLALCSINLSGQSLGDDKFLPFVIDQFQQQRHRRREDLLRDHGDRGDRELLAGEPLHPGAARSSAAGSRSTTSAPACRRSVTSSTSRSTS